MPAPPHRPQPFVHQHAASLYSEIAASNPFADEDEYDFAARTGQTSPAEEALDRAVRTLADELGPPTSSPPIGPLSPIPESRSGGTERGERNDAGGERTAQASRSSSVYSSFAKYATRASSGSAATPRTSGSQGRVSGTLQKSRLSNELQLVAEAAEGLQSSRSRRRSPPEALSLGKERKETADEEEGLAPKSPFHASSARSLTCAAAVAELRWVNRRTIKVLDEIDDGSASAASDIEQDGVPPSPSITADILQLAEHESAEKLLMKELENLEQRSKALLKRLENKCQTIACEVCYKRGPRNAFAKGDGDEKVTWLEYRS